MGDITTGFVRQYGDTLYMSVQQKGSRLRPHMGIVMPVRGEMFFLDRENSTTALDVTTRLGDSPNVDGDYVRRRGNMGDVEWGRLIDKFDMLKMLIDPTSTIIEGATNALGRKLDDKIVTGFFADAVEGKDGTSTVVFPAGNQIAVNEGASSNVGLTIPKLRKARKLLRQAEVDLAAERPRIAVTAIQLDDLLANTEVTSADYNTVKALVKGEVDTFMGFDFVHSERLSVDASGYRRLPVWVPSGMVLGVGMEPKAAVAPRPDKRFMPYAYFSASWGVFRFEDAKVLEIKCAES